MTTTISGTTGVTYPVQAGGTSQVQSSSGKVLQVVQGTTTGYANIASTSFQDIGLSASITPTSATSKVLIMFSVSVYGNAGQLVNTTIARNGSVLNATGIGSQEYSAAGLWVGIGSNYLDSPATTSALTYKIQAKGSNATNFGIGSDPNIVNTITLMEIAA